MNHALCFNSYSLRLIQKALITEYTAETAKPDAHAQKSIEKQITLLKLITETTCMIRNESQLR